MWPFFVIPGFVALMSLISRRNLVHYYTWGFTFIALLLFVGLRHKVGMDWNNYLIMIEKVYYSPTIMFALVVAEPGYSLLLFVSAALGFGVYGSNLFGTLIFCLGLFRYARTTPYPWTALLVAMPMLVTVVAMSANRQTVAIGVLLWILAGWNTSSLLRRAVGILFAALFHFSALFFLVFAAADLKIRTSLKVVLIGALFAGSFYLLSTTGRADHYDDLYVTGQTQLTQSDGAIFHVIYNGGPAALFFILSGKQRAMLFPSQIHRLMALLAVALIPAVFLTSVAAGRITLYLFPMSMYVISALPLLVSSRQEKYLVRFGIALFMLLMLFVWLAFANSSFAHIPYGNFLTVPNFERRLCC